MSVDRGNSFQSFDMSGASLPPPIEDGAYENNGERIGSLDRQPQIGTLPGCFPGGAIFPHSSASVPFLASRISTITTACAGSGTSFPAAAVPHTPLGIAGTASRGLLQTPLPWTSFRIPQQELFRRSSVMHPVDERAMLFAAGSSPLGLPGSTSRGWDPMLLMMERLQQALEMIPMTEKIDYLAGLRVAPGVVMRESDPLRFLRFADFDATAAAKKLAFYWKSRRMIFGDRAYFPMDMSENGALLDKDIEHIKSGYVAYAPNDSEGCTVVICDFSKIANDSANVRMRALFYHAQYISENPASQTSGFVVLCIVTALKYDHTTTEGISMLINTFPMKVKAWHSFDCLTDRNSLRQGFLLGFMEIFLHMLNKYTTFFHSSETKEDVLWELGTEHGMTAESIPQCLGGTWSYEHFDDWLLGRMSLDHKSLSADVNYRPMLWNGNQLLLSPRPQKRTKRDTEETHSEIDGDSKPNAKGSPPKNDDDGSVDELLTQFKRLLFNGPASSSPSQGRYQEANVPNPWGFCINIHEALQRALEAIPTQEKVDYLTALRLAPYLILHESDPARFLVSHAYDAQQAARGLVRYWKNRRDYFGERAFLPMTMTGDGSLTPEDIDFFKCGTLVISGQDRQGCPVIIFDPSRRTLDSSASMRLRAAFYHYQIVSEYPASQTDGFVVFHVIGAPNYDKITTNSTKMLLGTFPVKMKAFHVFDCMKKVDLFRRGFVQGLIGIFLSIYSSCKTHFHPAQRREEIIQILESHHGLSREVMPCSIGGSWAYESFEEWQAARIQLERERYCFHNIHAAAVMESVAATPASVAPEQPPSQDSDTSSDVHKIHSTAVIESVAAMPAVVATEQPPSPDSDTSSYEEHMLCDDVSDSKLPASVESDRKDTPMSVDVSDSQYLKLLEAEINSLPQDKSANYFEARKKAPSQIWETESNPIWFLRVEGYDPKKAAKRLVEYWRLRSKVFKSKRYELMFQTGEDALGRKELTALATGFLTLLPNATNGQSVLFIDPSLLRDDISQEARDRCTFYMLSLLTENEKSQTEGVIMIHKVNSSRIRSINLSLLEDAVNALSLKFSSIHLIAQVDIPVEILQSHIRMHAKIHTYIGKSTDALCSALESFGLVQAGLPKLANGSWGYEKFAKWQELRTRMEWKIPTGLSGRDCTDLTSFPAVRPYQILPQDEKTEQKRRMNLIHFRRKRSRNLVSIAMLEENCAELREQQETRLKEKKHLEDKHAAARVILTTVGENSISRNNIGFTWCNERFDQWQIQRTNLESETYFTVPTDSRMPERPSTESQHSTSAEAADPNLDAMLCEQNLMSSNDAVQLTSPICTFAQVQTNGNGTVQDNKHLSMLDSQIRCFALDLTATAAYMEAIQKASREIWNDECSAEMFLRVEEFDARKAAERLVRYWQLRSQVCGPRRHDRLTQTGDEVLGRRELPILNTGFLTLLPMNSEGRSVLCIDPGRLKDNVSKDARDRCIFYMMSLLTENYKSQTDGAILIHRVYPPGFCFVDAPLFEQ